MKCKQLIPLVVVLLVSTAFSGPLMAQEPAAKLSPAGGVVENGFWEIVSNIARPLEATVQFYDGQRHLIHEERVVGVKLDPAKRKIRRRLDRELQAALTILYVKK